MKKHKKIESVLEEYTARSFSDKERNLAGVLQSRSEYEDDLQRQSAVREASRKVRISKQLAWLLCVALIATFVMFAAISPQSKTYHGGAPKIVIISADDVKPNWLLLDMPCEDQIYGLVYDRETNVEKGYFTELTVMDDYVDIVTLNGVPAQYELPAYYAYDTMTDEYVYNGRTITYRHVADEYCYQVRFEENGMKYYLQIEYYIEMYHDNFEKIIDDVMQWLRYPSEQ